MLPDHRFEAFMNWCKENNWSTEDALRAALNKLEEHTLMVDLMKGMPSKKEPKKR